MIRYFLAAAWVIILIAASPPSSGAPSAGTASKAGASKAASTAAPEIPAEIRIPSSVGEVVFQHQIHSKDFKIKCVECHHQINAKKLNTPHPDYFKSSSIKCEICHGGSENIGQKAYSCSACHRTNPVNIADETLSAKVVVHKQCWKCHEVGAGKEASKGCVKCHSGKRT